MNLLGLSCTGPIATLNNGLTLELPVRLSPAAYLFHIFIRHLV